MENKIQVLAIIATGALLLGVLELVRQRKLHERYALAWMFAAVVLLVLSAWQDGLFKLAHLIGIQTPSNALFFVAFAAILLLLLHFSVTVSRLQDQSKVLAQRLALLEERVDKPPASGEDADPATDEAEEHRTAVPFG